ncbi:membrane protein [Streptomyces prasinosporus]|uniref:Membrane protein n=1 Tax=Streptomyces prasinosporus TaxID=68256 RepID=A0ABP6UDE1_9ACTN
MGIESDQVVYEYLSRVGDVAQRRQLPSAARMRLVAGLRDEIDRRRAKAVVDSPAAVRRIIARLGTPDEVVAAAADAAAGPAAGASAPPAAVPAQRDREPAGAADGPGGRPKGLLRRAVPRPRPAGEPDPAPSGAPSPPHRAGTDELGDSATQPDWWRVDDSPFGAGESVPGFVGGVEIPELLRPPAPEKAPRDAEGPGGSGAPEGRPSEPAEEQAGTGAADRRLLRLPSGGWNNPLLLLAAALLVAGAVLGNWFGLLLGWLIAYASRRLTRAEVKWAVVVLPGLAVAAGVLWLWGRTEGRWGDPVPDGRMNDAVSEAWPWVVRGAALASALFLVWRSQRRR